MFGGGGGAILRVNGDGGSLPRLACGLRRGLGGNLVVAVAGTGYDFGEI